MVPRGANWNPVPRGRPTVSTWGGFRFRPSREPPLMITSMAQLDNYIKAANRHGDMAAVARMCAYVRDAQLMSREERSPLQEAALMKWRIPDWVPVEGHSSAKAGDPNAPARVNTPRMADSPEEWTRLMWRYPRELTTCPRIHHAWDGISLSSARGMQMALGRAPRGASVQHARHAFILRLVECIDNWWTNCALLSRQYRECLSPKRWTMSWWRMSLTYWQWMELPSHKLGMHTSGG